MNQITIDGIVEYAPKSYSTKTGKNVTHFSVKNVTKSPGGFDKTTFIDVTWWEPTFEIPQGSFVGVVGELLSNSFDDPKTKQKIWKLKINAHTIKVLPETETTKPWPKKQEEPAMVEEDIPF